MKRSQQSVRSAETGATAGDFNRSQSIAWKNKGGRNATTNQARRGAGQLAPRPRAAKQELIASSSATAPTQAGMARVKDAGKGNPQGRLPLQSPPANITGKAMPYGGRGTPPAARGGPASLRAGGKNQTWPNGAMYTDAAKRGSSGKDGGPIATRMPKRRGRGAAFYGEYPS